MKQKLTIIRILGLVILLIVVLFFFTIKHETKMTYQYRNQPVIEHLVNNIPTLVKQYTILDKNPDYKDIGYQPRQFSAGNYKGWDILNTPNKDNVMKLDLNRAASVVVIWRGTNVPNWLSSWKKDGAVQFNGFTYPTYKKVITANSFQIQTTTSPILLFAEQNGKPSTAPKFPANLEEPKPNQTCPAWVHDEYKALAPDGKLYPTWHPQIDPIYWCYFHHEHGSDPALFDKNIRVPFGYAGTLHGMHEAHVGFKVYVWNDNMGHLWLAVQHQGTSTNQAACGNHHELDILAKDIKTNEIVSEQYYVGDYGISRPLPTTQLISPSNCKQEPVEKNNVGVRFLPVADHGGLTEEPWTVDNHGVIGFDFSDFTVNTYDPARMCKDITCDEVVYTGLTGTNHTLSYISGFGPKAGPGHEGIFYTNPHGYALKKSTDKDAVKQYIKPGVSISSNIPYSSQEEASCRDVFGEGTIMQCGKGLTSVSTARENAITVPN